MAARGELSAKTLEDGLKYMLDNEIGTDVSIEVGPPDGDVVTLRAHKCILMSRSEVFEGMFSSGMLECSGRESNIRVEDIDADIFKELLNYIYCESASICPESAAYLLYAAKKYMLPKLVTECCSCLVRSVRLKNVIHLLEQSLILDEPMLQSACLELISEKATTLLTGTEILSAPRLVMEAILKADTIPVRESVIYETAVNWAKHQLQSCKEGEIVTDLEIRETLDDLLYNIRFPVMKPSEFAEISSNSDLLTAEEKASVYYFLLNEKIDSQLKFSIVRRRGEELWISREVDFMPVRRWNCGPYVEAITFTTDQDVLLTGIGLYTACSAVGYDVDVEILQAKNSVSKTSLRVPYTGSSVPYKVMLDEPIVVKAGVLFSVKTLMYGRVGYAGHPCREVCVKETVTFTFSDYRVSLYTRESSDQIPRLYFCIM